jgi:hypothetical protein
VVVARFWALGGKYGLTQAQFAVDNRALMECLVLQIIIIIIIIKCELIFNYWFHVGTFGYTVFVHTLRNISGRPPTNLKLQPLLQNVTYQNVATLHTDTRNCVLHCEMCIHMFPEEPYEQLEVSLIGVHPKVVHLSCCLWTSCVPWTLSVSWRYIVQLYGPSGRLTHWTKQLSVKLKSSMHR